MTYNWDIFT